MAFQDDGASPVAASTNLRTSGARGIDQVTQLASGAMQPDMQGIGLDAETAGRFTTWLVGDIDAAHQLELNTAVSSQQRRQLRAEQVLGFSIVVVYETGVFCQQPRLLHRLTVAAVSAPALGQGGPNNTGEPGL